ncbi:Outer membrane porin F [Ferriphaselus amnicola]|uniref:Outer membrane porin F n=1 Tax=Ferriphaselus amnicola TaxID=1188319 RepID=A0A2Z6GB26_9PROT|nr:OmpA family protein [Ferriphaselus amnicola]BBE50713.1 Outer membrane porin F [Ferriphaselus amnicola]
MKSTLNFPLALITVAILSACASTPTVNPVLADAHSSYDRARTNAQVTSLATAELNEAASSLNKADAAANKGGATTEVNHWAYVSKQQVGIAQETAKRKMAEQAVNNAGEKRNEVRLDARTAEADAAKRQVAIAQGTVDQQTAELAAAGANAERDRAVIAAQEQQLKELNAKKTERGLVITLSDVLFRTDKSQLEPGGVRNVQKLAAFLNKYPQRKVLIEGHTDSKGSDSHNQGLSERRADAVRVSLIDSGVGSERIATKGYGEAYPVASNGTASSRQLNRRVEIILSDANGNIAPR